MQTLSWLSPEFLGFAVRAVYAFSFVSRFLDIRKSSFVQLCFASIFDWFLPVRVLEKVNNRKCQNTL